MLITLQSMRLAIQSDADESETFDVSGQVLEETQLNEAHCRLMRQDDQAVRFRKGRVGTDQVNRMRSSYINRSLYCEKRCGVLTSCVSSLKFNLMTSKYVHTSYINALLVQSRCVLVDPCSECVRKMQQNGGCPTPFTDCRLAPENFKG
jgi:hypothetical protein